MKLPFFQYLLVGLLFILVACKQKISYSMEGSFKAWQEFTFTFDGPELSEEAEDNPFLNYRLMVTFTNGNTQFVVPGFFAADGNAAETGAVSGNKWKVRFLPPLAGEWSFLADFKKGENIAVGNEPGTSTHFDGISGQFTVLAADPDAPGFLGKGKLYNAGNHFLKFGRTNKIFLKGGVDSPENLLGFADFDGTFYGGESNENREGESPTNSRLHRYEPHIADWNEGDPTWQNGKGKGLIGGLNYLASKGINSVYMLTNNIGGDGKDVFPYTSYGEDFTRFDVSKLEQWEIVFDHMDRLGIMCHFVTQETENELLLNNGDTGLERKLYYRELIARFAHHGGVTWNLGEENGPAPWMDSIGQTDEQRRAMASYIRTTDPYQNLIVLHTLPSPEMKEQMLPQLLDFEALDGPSLQTQWHEVHEETLKWRERSAKSSKKWVVCSDEIGPHWAGALPDEVDPDHDTIRQHVLWGNLMAGGAGVEWYFGYQYAHNDLNCEDWRSRDILYDQTRYARDFFLDNLPVEDMQPADHLVTEGYAMTNGDELFVAYKPINATPEITIPNGIYMKQWYDPRNGGKLLRANDTQGGTVTVEGHQSAPDKDWVLLLTRVMME